jgi:hypothetical protein
MFNLFFIFSECFRGYADVRELAASALRKGADHGSDAPPLSNRSGKSALGSPRRGWWKSSFTEPVYHSSAPGASLLDWLVLGGTRAFRYKIPILTWPLTPFFVRLL